MDVALRRSKKRVKNAIQMELPFLLTRELAPDLENKSVLLHSSLLECPRKETLDMHMARWKNLFSQMEKSLLEEGKHLVSAKFVICWLLLNFIFYILGFIGFDVTRRFNLRFMSPP